MADPTRRAMLEHLRRRERLTVSELAGPFDVSLPAILKHLNVLSSAGLVVCEKRGRTVNCRLDSRPMKDAMQWMGRYERYWSRKLDRLAAFVETEE
jgi:DNA-binding transcriptional ArsR family regulator